MESFGERLRRLRKEKNITLDKMANDLATTKATLSRYENNKRDPKTEFAAKAAEYLDVTLDYLLCKTDNLSGDLFNGSGRISSVIESTKDIMLNHKDEKDVEKLLNKTMDYIEKQEGLMLNGEILDDEDLLLLKQAVKNGLEYAKISNKKKYTPKQHRKNNN